jgi:hypothetical protein
MLITSPPESVHHEPVIVPEVRVPENVTWPVAPSVVKLAAAGVVPPMAPGLGNELVEPPRETLVPAMVMAEWANPALAREVFVTLLRFVTVGFG